MSAPGSSGLGMEAVTDPRLGDDVAWDARIRLDFFPQLAYEDTEIF